MKKSRISLSVPRSSRTRGQPGSPRDNKRMLTMMTMLLLSLPVRSSRTLAAILTAHGALKPQDQWSTMKRTTLLHSPQGCSKMSRKTKLNSRLALTTREDSSHLMRTRMQSCSHLGSRRREAGAAATQPARRPSARPSVAAIKTTTRRKMR